MKKGIVLVLALSSVSFGNTLNASIVGPEELLVGETAQIDIVLHQPIGEQSLLSGNMLLNVWGTGNATIVSTEMNQYLLDVTPDSMPLTMLDAHGYYPSFHNLLSMIPVNGDFVVFSIEVQASQIGEITIDLFDHNVPQLELDMNRTRFEHALGRYSGDTTPLTVTVIPEPVTLAMLVLGSCALIRRK